MASQPLIKLLTSSGVGSRRQLTAIIKRGGLAVNGKTVESFNQQVDPAADVITIDGKHITVTAEPLVYLMLNKPAGIISSTTDGRGGRTVIDILPEEYRHMRLYPVGRLDKDSTGLVLLTNDGDLTFRLTHPRFEQEKEYRVRLDRALERRDAASLEKGVDLHDGRTSPARMQALERPPFSYSVTIHEGRKRQVRRMFAVLEYRVLELKRIRLGSLRLGTLPEGQVRELTAGEARQLSKTAAAHRRLPR